MDERRVFEESTLEYLRNILRCHACMNTPKIGPIFQCEAGHLLCSECPSCCDELSSKIRSSLAERIRSDIPTPCHHSGCEAVLYKEDLDKHVLEDCMYRRLPCIIPTCEALVSIKDIVKHVDRDHIKSDTFIAHGSSLGHFLHVDSSFFEKESWWKPTLLEVSGNAESPNIYFAFQCHRTESGEWRLWVYCVGNLVESRGHQYQIILSLGSEELLYRDQTVYLGHSLSEITQLGYGLSLSDEGAKRFWDPVDMKIRFQVAVFRKSEKND